MAVKAPKKKYTVEKNEAETQEKIVSFSQAMDAGEDNAITDLWNEMVGGYGKKIAEQVSLLGSSEVSMEEGMSFDLSQTSEKAEEPQAVTEAFREYVRDVKNADIAPEKQKDAHIERKVEEIRIELKQLMKESKQLEATFKSIQVEQKIVNAGTYHENLFDVIRGLIKIARAKVQEGISWAGTAKGKKQQKEYWNMFQKHGTTFGMSHERTVATQTG